MCTLFHEKNSINPAGGLLLLFMQFLLILRRFSSKYRFSFHQWSSINYKITICWNEHFRKIDLKSVSSSGSDRRDFAF